MHVIYRGGRSDAYVLTEFSIVALDDCVSIVSHSTCDVCAVCCSVFGTAERGTLDLDATRVVEGCKSLIVEFLPEKIHKYFNHLLKEQFRMKGNYRNHCLLRY